MGLPLPSHDPLRVPEKIHPDSLDFSLRAGSRALRREQKSRQMRRDESASEAKWRGGLAGLVSRGTFTFARAPTHESLLAGYLDFRPFNGRL